MKKFYVLFLIIALSTALAAPAMAFSNSQGTELQSAYNAIANGIQGSWGMTFALVCVAVGLFLAWQFRNVLIFLGGIVAAVLVPNVVSIVSNMGACF